MGCPTCGLDNDPSAEACARCGTALSAAPPAPPAPPPGPPPYERSRRNLVPVLAGVTLVVLIIAGFLVFRIGGEDDPPATAGQSEPTAPDTPTTGPETTIGLET